MQIGQYEISALLVDRFKLDGGAMFGSVPKPLWEKRIPGDELNRIQLGCRVLVLRSKDRLVLVESGCGRKWEEKARKIYDFQPQLKIPFEQYFAGVTDVVLTHLHFDHAGGTSYTDSTGKLALSFPSAEHHLQRRNWERALNPGVRERATYLPNIVEPLKNARLKLHHDGEEILPQIRALELNGHTDGLQALILSDGKQTLAFPSDLVPTAHHLPLPYVMGYDLCASTTLREKEAFLERAASENWWIVFVHDADTCMAKVGKDEKGAFTARETAMLPLYQPGS